MYDGILNVYKEPGFTSHDVVAKLRGILKQKKIGHTGTLDPQAEGVLVVCLGKATKLVDILPDHDKEYEATLLLGQTTDTYDTEGEILSTHPVDVSTQEVFDAVMSFEGGYDQVPPMYSAIKVDGKKLYDLAREGIEIEREARPVSIDRIEISDISLPYVKFLVDCSRGTYIRSLCKDIGDKLGVGGCMAHLLRTKACGFRVEEALRLSEIEMLHKSEKLETKLHSIPSVFPDYPDILVKPECDRFLENGNPFRLENVASVREDRMRDINEAGEHYFLVYNSEKRFRGIYLFDPIKRIFKPYKMFL